MFPFLRRTVFEVLSRAALHETAANAAWTASFHAIVDIREAHDAATGHHVYERILSAIFGTFDLHSGHLPCHLADMYREAVEATAPSSVGFVLGRNWTWRGLPIRPRRIRELRGEGGSQRDDLVTSVGSINAKERGPAATEKAMREDWLGPPSIAIALTVGRFHSVTGYSPQGVGVASNVVIDGPVSSPPDGGEAALEGALPNEVIPPIIEVPCRALSEELIETVERRFDSVHGRNADPTWLGQLCAITNLEA